MKLTLVLIFLISCAAYTDPNQEKLTYYLCDKKYEIVIKHSDDYQNIMLKYRDRQILLHHFVSESGEGYRTENYLWLTSGKNVKLMSKNREGVEEVVVDNCRQQKTDLDP